MFVVKGRKTEELTRAEFAQLVKNYQKVVLDLGSGDGKFVVINAVKNRHIFWVGIDPSETNLRIGSRDLNRQKIINALLAVGSVEHLPEELHGAVDEVYINFPWGSLLETIVKPIMENLLGISGILKDGGIINVIFGYNKELEPSEVKRLLLPELSEDYIKDDLIPKYANIGLGINQFGLLKRFDNPSKIAETSWKKRLKNHAKKPKSGKREWFFMKIIKI